MHTIVQPYQSYLDSRFQELDHILTLGTWQVESAVDDDFILLLVNHVEQVVIQCRYDSFFERSDDIELLLRLPPNGEAGAGILAYLKPGPPTLAASAARPLPKPGSERGHSSSADSETPRH